MLTATLLLLVLAVTEAPPAQPKGRDASFWQQIVSNGYAVPEGESAASLMGDLTLLLGSPDPRLRDTYGYDIAVAWIYRDPKLKPAEMKTLVHEWTANLKRGMGSAGDDDVFRRSFSALDLSILAALDVDKPFLDQATYSGLLGAALDYLAGEKDLRAYDPPKGWIHATAHTADLLKFLARNSKLPPGAAPQMVDAIEAKLRTADVAFTHGEGERLSAVLVSLLIRADAVATWLDPWIDRLKKAHTALWQNAPIVDEAAYRSVQNQKDCLRSLYVLLAVRSQAQPLPPAAAAAQKRILDLLAATT